MLVEALVAALAERDKQEAETWTVERELLATLVEITHSLLLVTLRANGAKSVGKPIRVPRPGDPAGGSGSGAVSMGQFVAMNK
jgi:hypothetical protein